MRTHPAKEFSCLWSFRVGLLVQPTVFHINPLPLTQSSATDNKEFLMQTWLLGMKDGW